MLVLGTRTMATPSTPMRLRFGGVGFFLVVCAAATCLGLLLVLSPPAAIASVAVLLIIALVSQVAELPVTRLFIGAVLLSSSLVDLPGKVHAGGFSANAGLTVVYGFLAVLILILWPRSPTSQASRPLLPFVVLLVFAGLSMGWGAPSITAAQNILVLLVFVVSALCGISVAISEEDTTGFAAKALTLGSVVALALYGGSLALGGLGAGTVVGSRSFALFALVITAWGAAGWRYGMTWGRSLTLFAGLLVLLSLSRTAFAAALIIFCLAWLNPRSASGWVRLTAAVSVALGVAYLAVEHIRVLHDRIFTGDVQSVGGGVAINLEGRSQVWATTWHSYLTSPIFGHGVGTADTLITRVYSNTIGHPHNDYLRILHDYGLFGMSLWVVGYGWIISRTWRAWHKPVGAEGSANFEFAHERRIHAAAFLSLVGVALAMITDNVIDYMFVMGPVGVLIGLSLALEARRSP